MIFACCGFAFDWLAALAGVIPLDDVPIARRFMMRGEAEQGFKRDMPVETAVVSKDKFIEIGVDVFAAQAVIGAQRPSLHQRKGAVYPGQDNIGRHGANDARIVPVVPSQCRIGCVAISNQCRAWLYIGPHEGFDRGSRIAGDHGKAQAAGARIEVLRAFPPWFGLVGVAFDHLNGAGDQDFPSVARLEERVASPEWNFRLINLTTPSRRSRFGSAMDCLSFCDSSQAVL